MEHDSVEEPATETEDALAKWTKEDVENGVYNDSDDLLVLPPRFLGYATREKLWGQFQVDLTKPPAGPNRRKFHENLQLDQEYKDLIDALVKSHETGQSGQVQDMVSDKGKGLVLLLHGKWVLSSKQLNANMRYRTPRSGQDGNVDCLPYERRFTNYVS